MPEQVCLALDVMSGDKGAEVAIAGAAIARERCPQARFRLCGDEAAILPLLAVHPALKAASEVDHSTVVIRMEDKPSQALRQGRRVSSMWRAIDAVKTGAADVAVSAGNTGALMAMAKVHLKTMPGVTRPAIAAIWPTIAGESIVLDVGASVGADAGQLVEFAVMGASMAHIVFDLPRPTVGLLNIGVEEVKGVEQVKEAGRLLREADMQEFRYHGFVEGDDIGKGTVDVVVTEGFSGNIALKTAEGTARQIATYLRSAMGRTWRARLGYLLARPAFHALRDKLDPRKVNGGVFLGLNGIVIKSHGGTDAEGFATAIELGHSMARADLLTRTADGLNQHLALHGTIGAASAASQGPVNT